MSRRKPTPVNRECLACIRLGPRVIAAHIFELCFIDQVAGDIGMFVSESLPVDHEAFVSEAQRLGIVAEVKLNRRQPSQGVGEVGEFPGFAALLLYNRLQDRLGLLVLAESDKRQAQLGLSAQCLGVAGRERPGIDVDCALRQRQRLILLPLFVAQGAELGQSAGNFGGVGTEYLFALPQRVLEQLLRSIEEP